MSFVKDIMDKASLLASDEFVTADLPSQGSWPKCIHLLDKKSLLAIAAALGAQRPLLVRGEPGTGKSHFARAAASLLKRHFISTVVQPYTEYQELLWTFDFTQRLADAQLMSLGTDVFKPQMDNNAPLTVAQILAPERYTSPGPLWYAYDWQDACKQTCLTGYQPEPTEDGTAPEAQVLLIDEIDKADVSLSNGLLEVLGNRSFRVPHRSQPIGGDIKAVPPLVILTSNSIRELPSALLRRCVILDLSLPDGELLEQHLQKIGAAHFPKMEKSVLAAAAKQIRQDRDNQVSQTLKTGQAEYVDLLRALQSVGNTAQEQQDSIASLAEFFLKHQPQ